MDIGISELQAGDVLPDWLAHRADIDLIVPPEARAAFPTCVIHLGGSLDNEGADLLTQTGLHKIAEGWERLVIDLGRVESISNAGVIALYTIGATLQGVSLAGLDGHSLMRHMSNAIELGEALHNVRLAATPEGIFNKLNKVGLLTLMRHCSSVDEAANDFSG